MGRYLVVANQTLAGEQLLEELRALQADDPDVSFHVLVPATEVDQYQWHTEGQAVAVAEQRLRKAMDIFGVLEADLSGEVGDHNPLDAIRDAVRHDDYDGIILSTFPPGISRWLGMDLTSRLERNVDVPVTHVVSEPAGD